MADLYAKIIGTASNYLYSYVLIILLVGGGIYFTIRTKGVQLRYLLESIRVILEPSDKDDESISAFKSIDGFHCFARRQLEMVAAFLPHLFRRSGRYL
ncbi:MAG: hypothetical protein ACLSH1_00440 [Clostridia bacterium]